MTRNATKAAAVPATAGGAPARGRPRRLPLWLLAIALSAAAPAVEGRVLISEFLAINDDGLTDEDGDTSDWIELVNLGASAVDLGGWFLTDRPGEPEWEFPAGVVLGPGDFLVVFASGKDRTGDELHTSFGLDGQGEYLALLRPDGSVEHEYAPAFPPQREDISYGLTQDVSITPLVRRGAEARIIIPTAADAGAAWTLPAFDDGAWTAAPTGIGFETADDDNGDIPVEVIDLAPEGTATQSSTLGGFVASNAINGDFSDFSHTRAGVNLPATWQIDLGGVFAIESIVLHNRTSCCGSRLRDITVSILDASGTVTLFQTGLLNPENELGSFPNGPPQLAIDVVALAGRAVRGQIVRVVRTPDPDLSGTDGQGNGDEADVLQLGEVQVFGQFSETPPGFGDLIASDVESAMHGVNASLFARLPFTLADPEAIEILRLRVRYDDGFIAYLNGTEIARRNAPAAPSWSSAATASHPDEDALVAEELNVSEHRDLLAAGLNVLAVHALNAAPDDTDFLILPELVAESIEEEAPRYFDRPTPGAANSTAGIAGFVADTVFSVDRGFYSEPFAVEITTATERASIRYTLDGTAPDPARGILYDGPIPIDGTTTLRAIAYRDGLEPTNVDTQTYIFLDDVVRQTHQATIDAGFPSSWGGTAPDYGMDPDVIGFTGPDRFGGRFNRTIEDDLLAIPTMSIVMDIDEMFGPRGIYTNSTSRGTAWERACSVELIRPDGIEGFQVDCGIRIQGGAFRSHGLTKKHSLRLLFKGIYGPTKLRYPLFGPEAADRFDTITLRSNSNDGWQWDAAGDKPLYIRDSFGRETMLAMGSPASHETFVHLYINGIYWGLYNPVERPDNSFSAIYCGGDKDEWDAISNGSASSGSTSAWNTLLSMLDQGVGTVDAYMRVQGKNPDGTDNPALPAFVDVKSLIDYMITNLYGGNSDWPRKNYWVGRNRDPVASTGFKFYMWDSEWTLDLRSSLATDRTGVSEGVAAPYARLRSSPEFRLAFADRVQKHFFHGGALFVDPASPQWDPARPEGDVPAARFARLASIIDRAIVAESARWGDQHRSTPYTRDDWERERDDLLANYFPRRSERVLQQFRAAGLYPSIDPPILSRHGGRIETGTSISLRVKEGIAYYTLDGSDPRLPGGEVAPGALAAGEADSIVLLSSADTARVLVPSADAGGTAWTDPDFDDSSWISGPAAVGYERGSGYEDDIAIDLEAALFQKGSTVYMRVGFDVEDPAAIGFVTLRIAYDDGFAAYLNGTAVASANAPAAPAWNSRSTASHEARGFESFEIPAAADLLRRGRNVLAIHGLNSSASSSDMLIVPELTASSGAAEGGIELSRSTTVKARALSGTEWSALEEAVFAADSSALRITEVMYHPAPPPPGSRYRTEDFEFIELQNTGETPLNLSGIRFAAGVEFTFPDLDAFPEEDLLPGEIVLLVKNIEAFASRYDTAGLRIAGEYSGRLRNRGELILLRDRLGENLADFVYSDSWYPQTDGLGYSLEIADQTGDPAAWSDPGAWLPSAAIGGSPGSAPPLPGGAGVTPGDINQDRSLDVSDAVALVRHLFVTPRRLPCSDPGANTLLLDATGDARVDISDAIAILEHLFRGGPPHALGTGCVAIPGCPDRCSR